MSKQRNQKKRPTQLAVEKKVTWLAIASRNSGIERLRELWTDQEDVLAGARAVGSFIVQRHKVARKPGQRR
jgi:hypothetical protein